MPPDDQPGILCRKPDLFTKAAKDISDHVLLARQVLQIKLSRQPNRSKLFDIYHIGFMANFGYRERVVMQLHGNKFVCAFSDRSEETCKSAEGSCHNKLTSWRWLQKRCWILL